MEEDKKREEETKQSREGENRRIFAFSVITLPREAINRRASQGGRVTVFSSSNIPSQRTVRDVPPGILRRQYQKKHCLNATHTNGKEGKTTSWI